jgi:hypothetical protein
VAHRIQRKETFRGLIFFEIVDLAADGTEVLLLEGGEAPRVTDLYLRRTDGSLPCGWGKETGAAGRGKSQTHSGVDLDQNICTSAVSSRWKACCFCRQ